MKYNVRHTPAFKRDYKLMLKRHLPIEKLQTVVEKLRNGEELPLASRDHTLTGNWGTIVNVTSRPIGFSSIRCMKISSFWN